MVFTILISFWYVWVIVAIFIIGIIKTYKPRIKGVWGEKMLSTMLSFSLNDNYVILNNIMLHTERGSTQIDHIIVSIYGVFVIETKNYKGWIYGAEKDEYWVQSTYRKKNRFKNPIRQNYGHVKALQELLLDFNDLPIISIVSFSGECDLKVKVDHSKVVYFSGVSKVIKEYTNVALTSEQVLSICDLLRNSNIDSKENRKKHVSTIKENVADIDTKIEHNICPKCGGDLLVRQGKYGNFTGCSNYPKCRFKM